MAAPPELNLKDLTGDYTMNKTLSDDIDAILTLQGVGWWMRRAISFATITLHVQETHAEGEPYKIDIEQTATGGIKGTTEKRVLDWQTREHEDHLFGKLTGRSRWISLDMVEDPFLKENWETPGKDVEGEEGKGFIESWVHNEERDWITQQVWGFQVIDGTRYYARNIVVTQKEERLTALLVYDYKGKPEKKPDSDDGLDYGEHD